MAVTDPINLPSATDGIASFKTSRLHAWFETDTASQVARCRTGWFDLKSRCGRRLDIAVLLVVASPVANAEAVMIKYRGTDAAPNGKPYDIFADVV